MGRESLALLTKNPAGSKLPGNSQNYVTDCKTMELLYTSTTAEATTPAKLPSMKDLADLIRDHLPGPLVRLVPLAELKRRCEEINLEMPRFEEETPLVYDYEEKRRQRLANPQPHLAQDMPLELEYSASRRDRFAQHTLA